MIRFALVLHFYQPPTQNKQVTEAVFEQCYRPLVDLIASEPRARVTINISGSLINDPIFGKLHYAFENGQVELLISPSTHPLLPLIGARVTPELMRSQKRDEKSGVFPPELAVDGDVVERVAPFGDYCLVDESSAGGSGGYIYKGHKLLASNRIVTEILRSYPRELKVEPFFDFLNKQFKPGEWIVTVSDAELFGHHYRERLDFLKQLFTDERFEFLTCRELVAADENTFAPIDKIVPSTWQTTTGEVEQNIPWPLWLSPTNNLQQQYWILSQMAEKLLEPFWDKPDDPGMILDSARRHFFVGISSCHLYWLSNKPWWHPDLVEEGANQLIKCIRSLPVDTNLKAAAEELHNSLTTDIWQYHWSGEVEKGYVRHQQEREKVLASLPDLG